MSKAPTSTLYRQAEYDIDPVYLNRWSPRSFLDKDVPEDVLWSLFEAARWAPSAFNLQPWRFVIARTPEDREKFYPFISEFNLAWCRKAPVLVLVLSQRVSDRGENLSHAFDTGAAWGFLALEAVRKGLITHPMTGFDMAKARETLGIPDEYAIQALIAIGYQGPREALPDGLREREQPSQRRPLSSFVHEGVFGRKPAGKE
jgi:nitroreductase